MRAGVIKDGQIWPPSRSTIWRTQHSLLLASCNVVAWKVGPAVQLHVAAVHRGHLRVPDLGQVTAYPMPGGLLIAHGVPHFTNRGSHVSMLQRCISRPHLCGPADCIAASVVLFGRLSNGCSAAPIVHELLCIVHSLRYCRRALFSSRDGALCSVLSNRLCVD